MEIFDKLFGTKPNDDDQTAAMPWDQRPSIYDHVRSHVDPVHGGLAEGGQTLPDEERVNAGSKIRWAAGAMDGVATHHMGTGEQDEQVRKTVDLVLAFCGQPTAANKAALYQHIIDENTVSIIDPVIEALTSEERINHQRLYELAYSFVTEAADREPVKFGIAILGLFQEAGNEELFQTLGRHDEFTLFCCVALANSSEAPDHSLWTLAKNVDGWGRIHVVERLAQTEDAEVKDWLLREGYRNSVMYEYLAYTCATAGGLLAALSEDDVDRGLLTSAGEIIAALIAGGPAESIDDYEDAALVVEMYVRHIDKVADAIGDFLHVNSIKNYLSDEDADWEARSERGWTAERRSELLAVCDSILNRPVWRERVSGALLSDDEMEFHQANQAAQALGIDTWEHHWIRLHHKPTDWGRWWQVMSRCNNDRIEEVVSFAEQNIATIENATLPLAEMRLGPLDCVLQELGHFPGHGERLIETGLRSPIVRNRNMAATALAAWGRENWSESLAKAMVAASKAETEDDVRERMDKVLNGEPL